MSTQKLFNEKQWREFEIERWRAALRRGLHLRSLDPEHQQALFESVRPALGLRRRLVLRFPRLARPLALAARIAAMVALVGIGYAANVVAPAAAKWTRIAATASLRQTCTLSYAEMPVGESDSLEDQCASGGR
jgi:hypothetical protein